MSKRPTSESIQFQWKRWKKEGLLEYYGHPSPLARELWLYVMGIGKTRCESGHTHQRAGNRLGHVLHYLHRGEFWHRLNGKIFRAGTGNACLMDLSKRFTQGNDKPHAADLWWIYFDGKDAPRLRDALGVERNPVFEQLDCKRIESLFRELWALTVRPSPGQEAKSDALLRTILAELFASRERQADWKGTIGSGKALSDKVQMAVDFIERMYFKNIGIKHIADAVELNMFHLSRRFHEEVGLPPIQYLNRFRIEQAKRLLTTSDKTVGDIGRLVGIPDPGYFSRLFRKLTGQTPKAYCERERKAVTFRNRHK